MATIEHRTLGNFPTKMHGIVFDSVANEAALGAYPVTADNVSQKIVLRALAEDTLWIPTSITPTFARLGDVPSTRQIAATQPLRANGGASANLSANITLTINQVSNTFDGAVPQVPGGTGLALLSTPTGATWSTDFGANNLTTTGVLLLGATPRATTGDIRTKNAFSLFYRNFANSGDLIGFSMGNGTSSNTITLGNFAGGGTPSWIFLLPNGNGVLGGSGTSTFQWNTNGCSINSTVGTLAFAFAMRIIKGSADIFGAPNSANAVFSFFGDGTQNYQSGDKVAYWVNRAVEPLAATAGGFFLYSNNAVPKWITGVGDTVEWTSGTAAAATAGGAGALPATPAEYMTLIRNGNIRKIPLYAN